MIKIITQNKLILLLIVLISYLLVNTGIHGDELFEIFKTSQIKNIFDFINYTDELITSPLAHIFFWWTYPIIGNENLYLYDLLKIILHLLSIYFLFKFFSDYLTPFRSFLASILFIFYPTHDSSVFVYMFSIYTFIPALIMFCHHSISKGKYLYSYPLLITASFTHYLSPPYILGLSIIFLLNAQYKKFIIFLSSFFLYFGYYLIIAFQYPNKEKRVEDSMTIGSFFKNIIIQIITSIDSFFGPSFFLKIFLSIKSLNLYSLILGSIVIIFLLIYRDSTKREIPFKLLLSLFLVFVISLGMFSLTNAYSQITLGLGNRVTIYGSLFLAVILALMPLTRINIIVLFIIFILPTFGLSDHWKSWNDKQLIIISKIQENKELAKINSNDQLLIYNNNYSKLGSYSHIEFFSMFWNTETIFKKYVKTKNIVALSQNIKLNNNLLTDIKYNKNYIISKRIYLYNTENNQLNQISKNKLKNILNNLKKEKRHWIQEIENKNIRKFILILSPRLNYLFN